MGAIEVADLALAYGGARAVDGVSFEVAAGRVLRHPRAQRCRQDHHPGDDRGSPEAGRGKHPSAGGVALATQRITAAPDRGAAAGVVVLRTADRPRADPHLRLAVRRHRRAWRRVAGAGGAGRQGRHPRRGPLGRADAAAVDRLRPGPRPRAGVPRRADRGPRPAGPPQPLGPALRHLRGRPHRRSSPPTTWTRPRRSATGSRSWTTARCSGSTPRPRSSTSLDAPVRVVETRGTLEDVFLGLTGREYRA